jgi:hypothetical protein
MAIMSNRVLNDFNDLLAGGGVMPGVPLDVGGVAGPRLPWSSGTLLTRASRRDMMRWREHDLAAALPGRPRRRSSGTLLTRASRRGTMGWPLSRWPGPPAPPHARRPDPGYAPYDFFWFFAW